MQNCKICDAKTNIFLTKKVLNKYDSEILRCPKCDFIFTKKPYWLKEAYKNAIAQTDTGLVLRNLKLATLTEKLIKKHFNYTKKFVDYGGGYGLFVRLMRDKGLDFYRQDIYCENLFAQKFDIENLSKETSFNLLTAFEVFEHLEHPLDDIKKMLELSDSILFSTELQPQDIEDQKDWWYFSPETGQHISFYSTKTLNKIAQKFNLKIYTNKRNLHLLTKKELPKNIFGNNKEKFIIRLRNKISKIISVKEELINLPSLTNKDHAYIKKIIENE